MRTRTGSALAAAAVLVTGIAAGAGCRSASDSEPAPVPPDLLSARGFFSGALADLTPAPGVLLYEVSAELWSDHAGKSRFLALPAGKSLTFDPVAEEWQFPDGATVIKNFYFYDDFRNPALGRRIIETRLLVRDNGAFRPELYLWNDEQTDAVRQANGDRVAVSFVDENGAAVARDYIVPNTNQCVTCHGRNDVVHLLGAVTLQTNRDVTRAGANVNQLTWLHDEGVFGSATVDPSSLPKLADPFGADPVDGRARAWLHANCAHCHRPDGNAQSSGLVLTAWETNPTHLGQCKSPAAAGPGTGGHDYDVVPGDPDASIMPFRMASTDPAVKMPEIPNLTPDPRGLPLVRDWITALQPPGCP